METNKNNLNLETGKCFTSFVKFRDRNGTILPSGKSRPVVSLLDPNTQKYIICKSTSTEKTQNDRYGYELKDWKEAGFNGPSIIKCNKEDIVALKDQKINKTIGQLSDRDLKGLYNKLIEIRELEFEREQAKLQRKKQNDFDIER